MTCTVTTLVWPSASPTIWVARSRQTWATAAAKAWGSEGGPAAPDARRITVSLVEVQPSVDMALKLSATPARSTSASAVGLHVGVGGEDGQHRGHVRGQHGGALGHAADREALAVDDGLLAMGVGRPHRLGGQCPRFRARRPPGHERAGAGLDGVHREPVADETGAAHEDLARRAAQRFGHAGTRRLGVGQAVGTGGGVGAAAVEHHRRGPAVGEGQVGAGGDDRRRGHLVLGEDGGGADRSGVGGGHQARSRSPEGLIPQATPLAVKPAGAVTLTGTPPPSGARWSRAGRGAGWRTARRRPTRPW